MRKPHNRAGQRGFSLIELVAVLVIIGILAALALPRFADVDPFAERGFFEETLAATRYAQKLAIASGCSIRVEFLAATDSYRVARFQGGSDCTQVTATVVPVARPGSDEALESNAPQGVEINRDLAFYFDRVGRPRDLAGALISDPTDLAVRIGGRRLQVTPDTGLVREL